MKSVRLTLIFSLLWALCACSSDDSSIESRNGERVPIRLTASNVGVKTRATGNLQDAQMAEGETVKIDVERAKYWIANGAQPTDTVRGLLKKAEAAD